MNRRFTQGRIDRINAKRRNQEPLVKTRYITMLVLAAIALVGWMDRIPY